MNDLETWQLLLPFLAGPGAAILTGVLAKLALNSGAKAILNLAISTAANALFQLVPLITNGDAINWTLFTLGAFVTWVTSIATHFGFWKPLGTTEDVQNATKNFGIGPSEKAA